MNTLFDTVESMTEEFIARVMEHADSVRVVVTIHQGDKEETAMLTLGSGNAYAQQQAVEDWLRRQKQQARRRTIEPET